jgi:dynein heavy chain
VQFDEKLLYYKRKADEVGETPTDTVVDFVKVSNVKVIEDIKAECEGWKAEIGRFLKDSAKEKLDKLSADMRMYSAGLAVEPETLDDLKEVLNLINDLRDMSAHVENEYIDIEERFSSCGFIQ